MKTWFKYEN